MAAVYHEPCLTEEEVNELYNLFHRFDVNANGELDLEELTKLINNLGVIAKPEDLKNLVEAIDDNLSGTIDCGELIDYIDRMMASHEFTSDEVMEAFHMIDKDQGGDISMEELREAMCSADVGITEPEMECFFREVDMNGDGILTFSEFRNKLLLHTNTK